VSTLGVRLLPHACAHGRLPSGSRRPEPTRGNVLIDDLKNPEYRKGRCKPVKQSQDEPLQWPQWTNEGRSARFAIRAARAEFGRYYWSDELRCRLQRELEKSLRTKREAERSRRRGGNAAIR
jgi:hypothetical protein